MFKILFATVIFIFYLKVEASPNIVEIGIASNFSEISSSSSNPYGDYFRQGIQLAIEHNKSALKKKNIEIKLVEFDYGTSQMKVLDVAEKACRSKVSLVLGYVYSSDALLAAPIHQKCKLPLFSPSATANRLADFDSYVHLGAFNNEFQGKILAKIAKEKLNAKKTLIIYAEDCAYCTDLTSAFESEFIKYTGRSIDKISVLSTETDFSALADKVKKYQADVILVPNHELLSSRIISALVNKGISKPFLGGDGWGNHGEQFTKMLQGHKIDGYSVSHWFLTIPTPKNKSFIAEYQKNYKKDPNDTAVLSYDSMSIVIAALLDAKNIDRAALEQALQNIKHFSGVTGEFDYTKGRAPKKSLVLLKAGLDAYKFIKIIGAE